MPMDRGAGVVVGVGVGTLVPETFTVTAMELDILPPPTPGAVLKA